MEKELLKKLVDFSLRLDKDGEFKIADSVTGVIKKLAWKLEDEDYNMKDYDVQTLSTSLKKGDHLNVGSGAVISNLRLSWDKRSSYDGNYMIDFLQIDIDPNDPSEIDEGYMEDVKFLVERSTKNYKNIWVEEEYGEANEVYGLTVYVVGYGLKEGQETGGNIIGG